MRNKPLFFVIALLMSVLLSSCNIFPLSPEKQAALTQNAFSTVFAEMTTQAYLYPTATNTPLPTNTKQPTTTPSPSTTATQVPTSTFTPAPLLKAQLLYVVTYPENKTQFVPNEKFGVAIGFLNAGTVTWNAGTKLVLTGYDGEYVTVQTEAVLDKAVAPGEKVEFNLFAFGSEDMSYQSNYYQLYSDQGVPVEGGFAVFSYQPI